MFPILMKYVFSERLKEKRWNQENQRARYENDFFLHERGVSVGAEGLPVLCNASAENYRVHCNALSTD